LIVGTLAAGLAALGAASSLYHGRRLFHKWIRVVPKMDLGIQRISIESSEAWNQSVRVRTVQDLGESKLWLEGAEPGKAETT
jgi:hypothetical protein